MRRAFLLVIGLTLSLILVTQATPAMAQASIKLSINKGQVGEPVTVNGTGFPPITWVLLTYDDIVLKAPRTLNDGTLENTTIQIPDSTAGDHEIKAIRASDGTLLAYELFTVEPELSLEPDSGPGGSIVLARGTGYASRADITFTWSSSVGAQVSVAGPGGGGSGCHGRFSTAITVSAQVTTEAKVTVTATDGEGNSASADFTVMGKVPPIPQPTPSQIPPPIPPNGVQTSQWLIPVIVALGVVIVVELAILIFKTQRGQVRR